MSNRTAEALLILIIIIAAFAASTPVEAQERAPDIGYQCMDDSELALFFEITGALPVSFDSNSITVTMDGTIHSYRLNHQDLWCHVPSTDA